ncbi:hypothetical protein FIBSPDRAFT_963304 [Athelia psychrophila]|uniref:Uncharacterized protein n=1 Tax=Athelia psychrophila TaxID=1759441 RepID=A0A165Z4J7_9AGAM|nr:hypothetical protein FIBSPDRAFT_963304 [Fibularhizoctonia sp. CBS 109695]
MATFSLLRKRKAMQKYITYEVLISPIFTTRQSITTTILVQKLSIDCNHVGLNHPPITSANSDDDTAGRLSSDGRATMTPINTDTTPPTPSRKMRRIKAIAKLVLICLIRALSLL